MCLFHHQKCWKNRKITRPRFFLILIIKSIIFNSPKRVYLLLQAAPRNQYVSRSSSEVFQSRKTVTSTYQSRVRAPDVTTSTTVSVLSTLSLLPVTSTICRLWKCLMSQLLCHWEFRLYNKRHCKFSQRVNSIGMRVMLTYVAEIWFRIVFLDGLVVQSVVGQEEVGSALYFLQQLEVGVHANRRLCCWQLCRGRHFGGTGGEKPHCFDVTAEIQRQQLSIALVHVGNNAQLYTNTKPTHVPWTGQPMGYRLKLPLHPRLS